MKGWVTCPLIISVCGRWTSSLGRTWCKHVTELAIYVTSYDWSKMVTRQAKEKLTIFIWNCQLSCPCKMKVWVPQSLTTSTPQWAYWLKQQHLRFVPLQWLSSVPSVTLLPALHPLFHRQMQKSWWDMEQNL